MNSRHIRWAERLEIAPHAAFAQGSVDGPGLGHAHFGAADKRRDIGGIGIAITDEAFARATSENDRTEGPPAVVEIAELPNWINTNSKTPIASRYADQAEVRDVPAPAQELQVAQLKGQTGVPCVQDLLPAIVAIA